MLLIFLNWSYILVISLGMGQLIQFKIDKSNDVDTNSFIKTILYGLFLECVCIHIWAFFRPVNFFFYLVNILFVLVSYAYHYKRLLNLIKIESLKIKKLSLVYKITLGFLFIFTLAQSSGSPFVIDNESYYVQTIKWLNNYGFVKGLANLHVFLGQMSGWHVLQSAFSFPFLAIQFNDLNGFLYVIVVLFSIQKLSQFSIHNKIQDLIIGILPSLSVFFFLFIDSPSPDLPLFLMSQLTIYFYIDSFDKKNFSDLFFMIVLSVFMCLIKVVICPILVLPILQLFFRKKFFKIHYLPIIITSVVVFVCKNMIISGYPLFPLSALGSFINTDWQLNNQVLDFYVDVTKYSGYQVENYDLLGFGNLFIKWICLSGIDGLLNKLIVLLIVITPFFIHQKKYLHIYMYCVVQFLILFLTSPQYRFFITILLFLGSFVFVRFNLIPKKTYKYLVLGCVMVTCIPTLIYGFNFGSPSSNTLMNSKKGVGIKQILFPNSITKYENLKFELVREGNLDYHSPIIEEEFLYQTSNGHLPSLDKKLLEYLKVYYNHIPQLRVEKSLKEGFYSKEK